DPERRAAPDPGLAVLRHGIGAGGGLALAGGAEPAGGGSGAEAGARARAHRAAAPDRRTGGDAAARADRGQPAAVPPDAGVDGLRVRGDALHSLAGARPAARLAANPAGPDPAAI